MKGRTEMKGAQDYFYFENTGVIFIKEENKAFINRLLSWITSKVMLAGGTELGSTEAGVLPPNSPP